MAKLPETEFSNFPPGSGSDPETLSGAFYLNYVYPRADDADGTNKFYPDSENYANWSDADLQFIIDNVEHFGKFQLTALWHYPKRNKSAGQTNVGLYYAIKNGVKNPLLTRAAFLVAGFLASKVPPGQGYTYILVSTSQRVKTVSTSSVYPRLADFPVDYFIENQSDIFSVVAMENYSFENFDLMLTKITNNWLTGGVSKDIKGCHFAQANLTVLDAATFNKEDGLYLWPPDFLDDEKNSISIKKTRGFVDNSLYMQTEDYDLNRKVNYKRPFKLKSFENDATLDPTVGFSRFKVSTIYNYNFGAIWDEKKFLTTSSLAWFEFLFEAFNNFNGRDGQKFIFKTDVIQDKFEDAAIEFLYTKSKVGVRRWRATEQPEIELNLLEQVARSILNVFRKAAWFSYVEKLNDPNFDPETADPYNLLEDAFKAAEEAAKSSEETQGQPPNEKEKPLTDKEIEDRQRFMKQCALMTRLGDLANEHAALMTNRTKDKLRSSTNGLYNKRLYLVKDGTSGDQGGIITKILLPKADDISEFLNLKPAVHAFLTPKLRFYKVLNGNAIHSSQEIEFKFRNFTDSSRISQMLSSDFDRGGDYGIKEFSFSFEGATPATARNDIKAKLSLFFQSFQDFIEKRDGNEFPFVNMLLLPGTDTEASGAESPFQFSPEFYRLRVDVGWNIKSIEDVKKTPGVDYNSLKTALEKTNKSFYLNMIDHTINFNDDGSVQIDVDYRAYIESSLKGSRLDAMSSHKTRRSLKNARDTYRNILNKGNCSPKQLNDIRRQLLQLEDLLKQQTFQSIMQRMISNDFIYFKKVSSIGTNNFQKTGFFTAPVVFETKSKTPSKSTSKKEAAKTGGKGTFEIGKDFFKEPLDNDKNYNFINYFYLGDLLYVVLDALYEEDKPAKYVEGFERFKFILGSFEFTDIFDDSKPIKTINIASIPISVEIFFEWFSENVIKQERNNYPIMYFIRDLCTYLIGEILSENCFKASLDKKLQFHTTNFVGIGDPFSKMKGPIINLKTQYDNGTLPLKQDSESHVPISKMTNYVAIYVDTPKLTIVKDENGFKRGNPGPDGKAGIYHFQIGKDTGLLKKLKFSKTDMKYVREARFFRNGFDGLMQLANVYKVSLDMVGNTLYYPGMEIYVNPLGFLGASNSSYNPAVPGSIANKLGFGGYHLITRVNSSIAPGKFTTQVDAMFTYSGDGDPASTSVGSADSAREGVSKIDEKPAIAGSPKCVEVYDQIVNQALDIVDGKDQFDSINFDFSAPSAPTETETEETPTSVPAVEAEATDATVPTADDILGVETPTESVGLNILDVTKPAVKAYDQIDTIDARKYYLDGDNRVYEDGTTANHVNRQTEEFLFKAGMTP